MAPRGIPQIEFTFDIYANGILKVGARDKGTGKEQTITISGSTSLEHAEIDRMVRDAQANATEDKRRKQEVEARNEADTLAYRVNRQLKEVGDNVPVHEKARLEDLLGKLQKALQENASIEQIRSLTSDLQQAAHALTQAAQQSAAASGGCGGGNCQTDSCQSDNCHGDDNHSGEYHSGDYHSNKYSAGAKQAQAGEDVVDAEFEER
jgi:molecular chaperone DnaK